jgi:hypothetical protein
MLVEDVKLELIEVIQEIQRDSGFRESPLVGTTCPAIDVEGFESPLWLDAIGMLAERLGVQIPNGNNIFLSEDGKRQHTIDEAAAVVCEIVQKGGA